MFEKLVEVEARYTEIERQIEAAAAASRSADIVRLSKEHADLGPLVAAYREFKRVEHEISGADHLVETEEGEMRELARQELASLRARLDALRSQLKTLLLPADPNDSRNIILEIRAGTGGEEAALFAATLFRMYGKFAERRSWKVEIMNSHATDVGGFKEIIATVEGRGAYSQLKYESGVHRVQRVPLTEGSGRIHTSTATVAVLPEAEEIDVQISEDELIVEVFRASGPGGQSVNTTDSAVRITHKPTGLRVTCQDEKSQHKNKAKAMKVLRARLLDMKVEQRNRETAEERRSQVGEAKRAEKIRTYNFPQSRVTDHRIGLTVHNIDSIMAGDLDELIDTLRQHFQAEALRGMEAA